MSQTDLGSPYRCVSLKIYFRIATADCGKYVLINLFNYYFQSHYMYLRDFCLLIFYYLAIHRMTSVSRRRR